MSRITRIRALIAVLAVILCPGMLPPPGPAAAYQVGHTSMTFVDPDRSNREVPAEIYYPAASAGEDVPPASPPPEGFPVICFGHGYQIGWDFYDYLWQGLAGDGLVVSLPRTGGGLFPSHLEFGLDLAFVSRALRAERLDPASIFYGALSESAALGGHSMGGGASFLGTASDTTVTAIFNLAAAETNPSAIAAAAGVTCPALLFSGSLDCVTPPAAHQVPMYASLASRCKTHVTLTGGSHCQFAESNFICGLGEIGCPDPAIGRAEQHAITLDLLAPWLHAVLEEDDSAWADFLDLLYMLTGITWVQDCGAGAPGPDGPAGHPGGAAPQILACPNPVTRSADIRFSIGWDSYVEAAVFSTEGRRVRMLSCGNMEAGAHALSWDGADDDGRRLPPGVYFCRVKAGACVCSARILLLR